MSNKFNANVLAEYSKAYARRTAADFYHHHQTITGEQILSLTPINQINLFVISTLSEKWRLDAEKFRSPYFDFANADVQEALQQFMNTVSQHISVRREHLEPLLTDATRRTITMIFDPRAYFDELLRTQPDFTLTADALKQITRFTKINQFIPLSIAKRMNGKPFVYVNQALTYLDETLTQRGHELEHYDKFVDLFSEKVPMDVSALLRSHVPDSIPAAPVRSFFDMATESAVPPAPLVAVSDAPEDVKPALTSPVTPDTGADGVTVDDAVREGMVLNGVTVAGTEPARVVEDVKSADLPKPVAPEESGSGGALFLDGNAGPEPVAPVSQPSQGQTGAFSQPSTTEATLTAAPVAEPVAAPTLNDVLRENPANEPAAGAPVTVAETFHRAPIESIGRSISLNQKFRFINQLFNGNTSAYNQAIQEIDTLNNYGQALDLISYRYASQFLWDMSSDEVSELVDILKRRFA